MKLGVARNDYEASVSMALGPTSGIGGGFEAAGRDLPHLTSTVVPSMSTPEAQASAARSAD